MSVNPEDRNVQPLKHKKLRMDHLDAGAATGYGEQRFGLLMIDEGSEAHAFHCTKTRVPLVVAKRE